ncbi:MAG: hypothetical protein FJ030_09130 [Chloroflexi bacterium]|nr:hypothetical protein [Chloroflexota bacterium]
MRFARSSAYCVLGLQNRSTILGTIPPSLRLTGTTGFFYRFLRSRARPTARASRHHHRAARRFASHLHPLARHARNTPNFNGHPCRPLSIAPILSFSLSLLHPLAHTHTHSNPNSNSHPPTRSPGAPLISESTITLASTNWRDHLFDTAPGDPLYPYPRLDYDPFEFDPSMAAPIALKAVVLENKYVSLTFLPELGGRLYR